LPAAGAQRGGLLFALWRSPDVESYLDDERFYKEHFAARMRDLISRERLGALIAAGVFDAARTAIKQSCSGSVVTPAGDHQQNNLLNQWDRRAR
jgi:hypothetical protein